MKTRKIESVTLAILLSGAALLGAGESRVRVIHASPDAPPVDVLVNDAIPAFEDVAFEQVTPYATLPAGVYNFKVVPAGAGPDTAVIDADLALASNRDYTVVAAGYLAGIEPLVLADTNRPVAIGKSRVRFLHASPDAPAVDIALAGGPVLFADVAFRESAGYATVPAGTYDLEVRLAGTDTVVLPLPGVELGMGRTYTAIAVGEAGAGTLKALLALDSSSPALGSMGKMRGLSR